MIECVIVYIIQRIVTSFIITFFSRYYKFLKYISQFKISLPTQTKELVNLLRIKWESVRVMNL